VFENEETPIEEASQQLEELGKRVQAMKERGKELNQY